MAYPAKEGNNAGEALRRTVRRRCLVIQLMSALRGTILFPIDSQECTLRLSGDYLSFECATRLGKLLPGACGLMMIPTTGSPARLLATHYTGLALGTQESERS